MLFYKHTFFPPFKMSLPSFQDSNSIYLLGSQNREKESRMAVAKRPGREKPRKIEQRKVWGQEWGSQVKQTALLAGPIYIGQAQGENKTKNI